MPTVSVFGPTDPALVGPWGYSLWPETGAFVPGSRHVVVRAPRAADGATDYRQQRDDDTLIATVPAAAVTEAAVALLARTADPASRSL